MANDIDMWRDIEEYGQDPNSTHEFNQDLLDCYTAKYIEGNEENAEKFKEMFIDKYKFWNNWY